MCIYMCLGLKLIKKLYVVQTAAPTVIDFVCCVVCVQAQLEAQGATQDFQRSTEVLRAAKETISLAEQRLLEEEHRHFDSAWQEMLNHATQRVSTRTHTKPTQLLSTLTSLLTSPLTPPPR